jgi:hypothetical protein
MGPRLAAVEADGAAKARFGFRVAAGSGQGLAQIEMRLEQAWL